MRTRPPPWWALLCEKLACAPGLGEQVWHAISRAALRDSERQAFVFNARLVPDRPFAAFLSRLRWLLAWYDGHWWAATLERLVAQRLLRRQAANAFFEGLNHYVAADGSWR
jgi:hypothetical protein